MQTLRWIDGGKGGAKLNAPKGMGLSGDTLYEATLSKTNLVEANLADADLRSVDARGAIFGAADLTDALLFGADLSQATFTRATLANADLRTAISTGDRNLIELRRKILVQATEAYQKRRRELSG